MISTFFSLSFSVLLVYDFDSAHSTHFVRMSTFLYNGMHSLLSFILEAQLHYSIGPTRVLLDTLELLSSKYYKNYTLMQCFLQILQRLL